MTAVAVRGSRRNRLLKQLSSTRVNTEKIARELIAHPALLTVVFLAVKSDVGRVKFAAAKALRAAGERAPHLLYRHFDALLEMLDSPNAVLRWNATQTIANLAGVDHQERIERMLDRFMHPIYEDEMIGAATAIQAGARIAAAKPHLADRIAQHILCVEHAVYKTPECRNVAIGHAILAFDQFFRETRKRNEVSDFVRRQLNNSRPGTKKKAETFLKKWAV